jgi:hypothetical protein
VYTAAHKVAGLIFKQVEIEKALASDYNRLPGSIIGTPAIHDCTRCVSFCTATANAPSIFLKHGCRRTI